MTDFVNFLNSLSPSGAFVFAVGLAALAWMLK